MGISKHDDKMHNSHAEYDPSNSPRPSSDVNNRVSKARHSRPSTFSCFPPPAHIVLSFLPPTVPPPLDASSPDVHLQMPFDPRAEVFPQELFDLIIEAVGDDRPTLRNLSLVSRAFLPSAQRRLFQRVRLGGVKLHVGGNSRWHLSCTNNDTLFFTTLLRNPLLAYCVRDFSYRPDAGHSGAKSWSLLHQALHEMVNLKRLQLTLMTCDNTLSRILGELGGHPFQLEVFSWKDYRWKMSDNERAAFVSFLLSQPHLKVLDILSCSMPFVLPKSSCPNLTTFVGDLTHAIEVLPGRTITNLVWTGSVGILTHVSLLLAEELSRLRVLVFHDAFPIYLNHADLMGCLHSLEALHISFTPRGAKLTRLALIKVAEILSCLPMLRRLRVVTWTGVTPVDCRTIAPELKLNFPAAGGSAAWLFDRNPCLERVYVSEPDQLEIGDNLRRWKRGEVDSTEVGGGDLQEFYQSLGFDSSLLDRQVIHGL